MQNTGSRTESKETWLKQRSRGFETISGAMASAGLSPSHLHCQYHWIHEKTQGGPDLWFSSRSLSIGDESVHFLSGHKQHQKHFQEEETTTQEGKPRESCVPFPRYLYNHVVCAGSNSPRTQRRRQCSLFFSRVSRLIQLLLLSLLLSAA